MDAYEQGVITREECQWFFGPATGPLTDADLNKFGEMMKKVDGWTDDS